MKRKSIPVRDLRLVATAESFRGPREPSLGIGDVVRLNSGGPESVVVDLEGRSVTVAWRGQAGEVAESVLPEPCFHRVKLGSYR